MLFDAVAEKERIGVSQDELAQYLVQSAQQYGMQPQEFVKVLQQNNQLPVHDRRGRARARRISVVLGKVKVVDTDGNAVDLSDFIVTPTPELEDDEALEAPAADEPAAGEPEAPEAEATPTA